MYEQGASGWRYAASDPEAESRLLDVILGAYEGSKASIGDPEFTHELKDVCEELAEEGRQETAVQELLRGAFIDAEALRTHIQAQPNPNDSGKLPPLNDTQQQFIVQKMMRAFLPHIRSDGTYDMVNGAERADFTIQQLCSVGYDGEAVKILAAEALTRASNSLSAFSAISPEVFDA